MQKKVTILWEQTDSEGWGSAGSGRTPSWKKNPALFLSQDVNDTMWGGHCFNKLWRRTGESSDPALPTLHSEDWIISMWDLPPPVYYTEAQEDSVPSPSISGIFKDGDEPEWFSAHGERGLLSSEVFFNKFIPALLWRGSLGWLWWEGTKSQLLHLRLQQCGRKKLAKKKPGIKDLSLYNSAPRCLYRKTKTTRSPAQKPGSPIHNSQKTVLVFLGLN